MMKKWNENYKLVLKYYFLWFQISIKLKMKILILGSGGLIGNTMTRYFFEDTYHEVFGMLRDNSKLSFSQAKELVFLEKQKMLRALKVIEI